MKKSSLSFGFSAVVAGQKNAVVNASPMLIANSTKGKFTITSPVSKALNIAAGDNIMFLNNISQIEAAIAANNEDLVNFCNENGLDYTSSVAHDAILKEFGMWAIAKGVKEFEKNGAPRMVTERYTEADKKKFIEVNKQSLVEANREVLIEKVGNADATDEELAAAITTDMISAPEVQSVSGSKTASTSSMTGVGLQLGFTDSAVWNSLKKDIESPEKVNRNFNVLLDQPINTTTHNGYEEVAIIAYPIEFAEDTTPRESFSKKK